MPFSTRPAAASSARDRKDRSNQSPLLGLVAMVLFGCAAIVLSPVLGGTSPMLLAILAGFALRNTLGVPECWAPGVAVAARTLLRWGVVLLGLQLSLAVLWQLGPGIIVLVVAAVLGTMIVTVLLGKALGLDRDLTLLIAAGFSICGAAAVAGMQGVVRASEEKVASAIALVVLFGTLMIPASMGLTALFALDTGAAGTFIGGSVHEVAQVVAAAGIVGGEAVLALAVPIKLARVVLLAPVITAVSVGARRSQSAADATRPPLVPLFVLGFLAAMLIATWGIVPPPVLEVAAEVQRLLLASAMVALGAGVHVATLRKLGARPLIVAFGATVTIVAIVGAGTGLGLGA